MSKLMSFPPRAVVVLFMFLALVVSGEAEKKKSKSSAKVIPPGRAVMWEPVNNPASIFMKARVELQ